jgi:hypothetical protein
MASKTKGLKPGQKTPTSGQYGVINAQGRPTGREVTAVEGKPLPPTAKRGQTYRLVDKTKHKQK